MPWPRVSSPRSSASSCLTPTGRRARRRAPPVFEYIEVWYNRQRRRSSLGYLSPVAYELQQEFTQAA